MVVVLKMSGRGRGSGVPVEEEIAHLWTIDNGKAVAMQVYSDPQDALRDARASAEATKATEQILPAPRTACSALVDATPSGPPSNT